MGWYGDYNNVQEVIKEKKSYKESGVIILEEKATRNYGAILYQTENGKKYIDYFIFKGKMYKPLSWCDDICKIPKKWIKQILPYACELELLAYQEYLKHMKQQKTKKVAS